MERFQLRQKFFSFGDDYTIKDERGRERFFVDGKVLTLRNTLVFEDMQENELAVIRQRILAWGPTFEIERDGKVAAIVKKHLFTLFRCHFTVDVPGPDDLEAQGSFFDYEYEFTRGGRRVAEVSKRYFSFTDSYGVEIADGEDAVLLLAATVVIDQCCHEKR
jgi:uncharacterized protein YxjI